MAKMSYEEWLKANKPNSYGAAQMKDSYWEGLYSRYSENYIDGGSSGIAGVTLTSSDPSKSGSASDRVGNLIRAEWSDYVARFQPYDTKLIGLATGDSDNNAAIERARSGVAGSFDVAQGTLQRDQQRLGLSSASDEVAAKEQSTSMTKTAAEVNAVNGTRLHTQDRDLSLMAGDAAAGLKSGRLSGA